MCTYLLTRPNVLSLFLFALDVHDECLILVEWLYALRSSLDIQYSCIRNICNYGKRTGVQQQ